MTDPSLHLVLPYLQSPTINTLWVADENALGTVASIRNSHHLQCVTNRYDIFQEMNTAGVNTAFSDYDFSEVPDSSVELFVYRVSKERAVVHHVINNALRCLKLDGKLILVGEKNDGIKGYCDKASKLFGNKVKAKKSGYHYSATIPKAVDFITSRDTNSLLDDKHYSTLRSTGSLEVNGETLELYSKPGQFGWNKQDQGSQLLIKTAEQYFAARSFPQDLVDLGCGYGFLTLKTKHWPTLRRAATDNNAAALTAAKRNFLSAGMSVAVTPDDCGKTITDVFECVLCNPPFHQGFANDSALTQKFLHNAARLTKPKGVALFVVNQFIALEKLSSEYFACAQRLDEDGQFKVVALSHIH